MAPSEADTATLLAFLGVSGEERVRLLELAREAADPDWLAPGINRQLAMLAEYERTAHAITNVEPCLIPGLLQTPAYAKSLMAAFGATRGESDHRTMIRAGRQRVLTDSRPVPFLAIIGEYALRYPPCEPKVMVEQLLYLIKMSQLDNITLHVLPLHHKAAAALMGSWMLIEFGSTKPVVHLEHYDVSVTLTDQKAVARYRDATDTLRGLAMSPETSSELIAGIIQ